MSRTATALLALLVLPAGLLAQSLGEVAARDRERRARERASPAPSYDDTNLQAKAPPSPSPSPSASPASIAWPSARPPGWRAPSPSPVPAAVPSPGAVVTPPPAAPSSPPPDDSAQARAALEAHWRGIAARRREAVVAAEKLVAELNARVAGLQNDMSPTNLGDPNREQTLRAQAADARARLAEAEAALAAARKAVDDLEDEARRAGALPGWVR